MGIRPAYDPPDIPRSRQVYTGYRRQQVAKMRTEGQSQRDIADTLGVSKSTIARDCKWLESAEHMLRAQDTADLLVDGAQPEGVETDLVPVRSMPTNLKEYQEMRRQDVIALVSSRMTYRQTADKLGCSIDTVIRDVNTYLQEYGDWGGRTMAEWRNEELVQVELQLVALQGDMDIREEMGMDAEGGEKWNLSPYQAASIRAKARKQFSELLRMKAQLLSLLVQRHEVDVTETKFVVKMRGVDFSKLGPQDATPMKGIIIEQ